MTGSGTLPLPLLMLATHAAYQPDLDQLARALDAAQRILRLQGPTSLVREEASQQFIQREGEDRTGLADADATLMTAAQVSFGDTAFLYGLACAWLLCSGKDGAR